MISLRKLAHRRSLFISSSRFFTTQTPNIEITTSADDDHPIATAARAKNFAEIPNLINKLCENGSLKASKTFDFISKTEKEPDLRLLVDELVQVLARLDNFSVRKLLFDALIRRLVKLPRIKEARKVTEAMISNKFGAGAQTFLPILSALTKNGRIEEAWKLIDFMKDNQISPDCAAYNSILASYCTAGDLNSAAGVLIKMEEEGLTLDSEAYDWAVLALCKVKKVETAMTVLRLMEDEGVLVLQGTYAHIISSLLELGEYGQAVEFVMGYKGKDKRLDSMNLGLLATRLVKLNKLDEAILVLKEMKNSGMALNDKLDEFYRKTVLNET